MKKVLIVDNSSYMRMFVKKIVEKGGAYAVFEASDQEQAMDSFKLVKPDIVILDLNMSEDTMEGMQVLKDIMRINPETTVIIVSAIGHQDVRDECIAIGARCYIKKPIDTKILLKSLE